jgi:hypothetical protein
MMGDCERRRDDDDAERRRCDRVKLISMIV